MALLTRKQIELSKPRAGPYEVRDSLLKGLLLRVQPSGCASYVVERARGRRMTFGRTSVLSPEQARLRVKKILGQAADGVDSQKSLHRSTDVRKDLFEDAQRRLDALAAEIRADAGSPPECLLRMGNVLAEAVAAADLADLLVLGAHGLSRTRDLLLGTTAERLLLRSRRPMLVVRVNPQQPYRNVLVPVDFSLHSMAALRCARQIAPTAHLRIFHAYENPYEGNLLHAGIEEKVTEKFRLEVRDPTLANLANLIDKTLPADPEVSTSIDHGDAKFLIPAEAEKQGVDLIVIGKHGRAAVGEFFLGGATRATAARAKCDVVVAPDYPRL